MNLIQTSRTSNLEITTINLSVPLSRVSVKLLKEFISLPTLPSRLFAYHLSHAMQAHTCVDVLLSMRILLPKRCSDFLAQ